MKVEAYNELLTVYKQRNRELRDRAIIRMFMHEVIGRNHCLLAAVCFEKLALIYKQDGMFSVSVSAMLLLSSMVVMLSCHFHCHVQFSSL